MTTYTVVKVDGTAYPEYVTGKVVSSIGENNTATNFSFTYMNYTGYYTALFNVGDVVDVWIDDAVITDTNNATKIITGIVEDIDMSGTQVKNSIVISGRDYTARMQDITIPPEVYTNQEVSNIIDDFIAKYAEDITYNKVVIGTMIDRISFNHTSIFDAVKRLADLCNCYFYIDTDKVLHFKIKGTVISGKTFDNTNTTKAKWKITRREMVNQTWVYGDSIMMGKTDVFTANGGSVYTLTYEPHNITVTVNGVVKRGDVFEMVSQPESGTHYLVNYHDKQIIFISGTNTGNNIPTSGTGAISGVYDRAMPIVKFGRDRVSVSAYGIKEKVISDKNIKDPQEAVDRIKKELELYANPKRQGTLDVEDVVYLVAGQTCIVNLPNDGVTNQTYTMIEIYYDLNKNNLLTDQVISIKVNKRVGDVTDTLKQLIEDVKLLQGDNILEPDILTRVEFAIGSVGTKTNYTVSTRNIGSAFYLDHATNSILNVSGLKLDGLSGASGTWVANQSGGTW